MIRYDRLRVGMSDHGMQDSDLSIDVLAAGFVDPPLSAALTGATYDIDVGQPFL